MTRRFYVSRDGFTQCPTCARHTRVDREALAQGGRDVRCEFCGNALLDDESSVGATLKRAARAGRSSIVAASLFGLTAVGPIACDDEDPSGPGDVTQDANQDATGDQSADAQTDTGQQGSDTLAQPPYGLPGDTGQPPEPDATDVEVQDAEDAGLQPEYGVVPDVTEPGDASDTADADVEVEDAADAGPQPEYGIVPDAQ